MKELNTQQLFLQLTPVAARTFSSSAQTSEEPRPDRTSPSRHSHGCFTLTDNRILQAERPFKTLSLSVVRCRLNVRV